jgi:hypothetical protein
MDSELASLMPNNMQDKGLQESSPNTSELRKYVQVGSFYNIYEAGAAAFMFVGHSNRQLRIRNLQAQAVLAERGNIPPQAQMATKMMRFDDLELRRGPFNKPQAKRFCLRVKR